MLLINSQLKLQLYNMQVYTGYGEKYEVQLMSLMVKYDIENKMFSKWSKRNAYFKNN